MSRPTDTTIDLIPLLVRAINDSTPVRDALMKLFNGRYPSDPSFTDAITTVVCAEVRNQLPGACSEALNRSVTYVAQTTHDNMEKMKALNECEELPLPKPFKSPPDAVNRMARRMAPSQDTSAPHPHDPVPTTGGAVSEPTRPSCAMCRDTRQVVFSCSNTSIAKLQLCVNCVPDVYHAIRAHLEKQP